MSRPWRKPRIEPDEFKFAEFSGVVNTRSRKDIGEGALVHGNNVVITDAKKIQRRAGYTQFLAGTYASIHSDGSNLYAVEGGTLKHVVSDLDIRSIVGGLTGPRYSWDEINGETYFVNGIEAGIVRGDAYKPWRLPRPAITSCAVVDVGTLPTGVLNMGADYADVLWRVCATYEFPDGRESAPSDCYDFRASPQLQVLTVVCPAGAGASRTNLYITEPDGTVFRLAASTTSDVASIAPQRVTGRELTTYNTESLPEGVEAIQFHDGRCYAGQYFPAEDISVIWISKPLAFHLFNPAEDYVVVPGRLALLLSVSGGLLVGTSQKVGAITAEGYDELADYGCVPGSPGDTDSEGKVAYFWTERGVCKALPFENLTEQDVSMPPGLSVSASMVYMQGMQHFVAVTRGGGTAFNQRTERT